LRGAIPSKSGTLEERHRHREQRHLAVCALRVAETGGDDTNAREVNNRFGPIYDPNVGSVFAICIGLNATEYSGNAYHETAELLPGTETKAALGHLRRMTWYRGGAIDRPHGPGPPGHRDRVRSSESLLSMSWA